MPRKQQGWITFQSSETERQILDQYCQTNQRTKTEVLRELVRSLKSGSALLARLLGEQTQTAAPDSPLNELLLHLEDQAMKISARNLIKGTVKQLVMGAVNAEVTLEITPDVEITAVITRASAERLQLAVGATAYAMVKSSDVMIAVE